MDTINKIFFQHLAYRMLWYSSIGLLFTSLGLLTKNAFVLTSMFCALVVIETLWTVSFFFNLIFHYDLTQVASYAFVPNFPQFDFLTTLYHLVIVPFLIYSLFILKKIHSYGWVGAGLLTLALAIITQSLVRVNDNVNCIKQPCQGLFIPLYSIPQIERIIVVTILLVILLFYPLNQLLLRLAPKMHWKIEGSDYFHFKPLITLFKN